jgi:hypothetical protein
VSGPGSEGRRTEDFIAFTDPLQFEAAVKAFVESAADEVARYRSQFRTVKLVSDHY